MDNLLIVGKSSLGQEIQKMCGGKIVGRPEYDLSKENDCDMLMSDHNPKCVILTHGILNGTPWQMSVLNYASMIHLIAGFYNKMEEGQIIVVSSASVNWPSWPGVGMDRMIYGNNKESLSNFCHHLNRKNIPDVIEKNVSVQVYEPNSFNSKMNKKSNTPIDIVAREVKILMDNPRISVLRGLNR